MNQTERIADGRRRFFSASGKVHDVLLRGVKSHHDKGLQRGRDYEVETGGVSLRQIPPAGSTVIILTGDRVREEVGGGPGLDTRLPLDERQLLRSVRASTPASLGTQSQCPTEAASLHRVTIHAAATNDVVPIIAAAAEQRAVDPPPVFLDNIRPAPNVDPAIFDAPGIKPPTGPDLDRLKRALLYGTRDTNDKNATRTAEWQDGLAQLTAVMLNAPDWDATRAAFLDITTYLHRG
jgi:hypothetical protein